MPIKTLKILTLILALCAGIAMYSLYKLQTQPDEEQTETVIKVQDVLNRKRPEFSLYDLDQNLRNIQEWDGKVIVLNFWGTWCPPCLKEIPDLNTFYNEYKNNNVEVIGIAHDTPVQVRQFMQELDMQYPQLVDPLLAVELSRRYGNELGTLPYTVIIDKAGIVRYIHSAGIITRDELSKIVNQWL